ncbi:MAG: 2-C-methyl-D-erythritol 4-phosphate cytidylyltransferase, partial [Pseudomonadota bacterium]|nr:2-C-methyl-D-erythritol 4-phosphate cytidylyltransferase [Pseudomonadota bacterium]
MTISASASPKDSTSLTAIIVAAGGGARMGGGLEKQFRDFGGRPVLAYSVDAFLRHTATRRVVVVVAEGRRRAAQEALGQLAGDDRVEITTGGDRRQDSVRAGLAAADSEAGLVAIHDAARPLLSQQMISTLVHAMTDDVQAALPVLPVVDTLKTLAGTRVESTTSRTNLGRAQTPQIFRRDHLL